MRKKMIMKLFKMNRHCIVTMFLMFVIVFTMTIDVFAENTAYWGNMPVAGGTASYESGGTVVDVYDLTETNGYYPTLSSNEMLSYYGGSGTLGGGGSKAQGFPVSAQNFDKNGLFIDSNNNDYCLFVPTNMTQSSGGNSFPLALNAGYYLGTFDSNTFNEFQNWRFSSAGNIALVSFGNYFHVVSDQPLYWGRVACNGYYGVPSNVYFGCVDVADSDGLYHSGFENYTTFVFSDMPIYLSSSDGITGFTGEQDFSFSNDNMNFNNLMRSGIVPDPSAPSESEIEKVSKSYMNFTSTDSWTGDALTQMYHNVNFNANEYQRLHGEQFQIVMEHSATYKDSSMQTAVTFSMPDTTIKVDMLMAQSPRGTMVVPIDLHNMKDTNGTSIRQYLLNTIYTVTGTHEEYININFLGDIGQGIQDIVNSTTGLSFTPFTTQKVVIRSDFDGVVEEFNLYSKIYIRSAPPDFNYESDFNSSQYNLVTGNYDIEQNGGANNLYPPSENPDSGGVPSVIPTPSGGNGSGSEVTVNSGGISNILKDLANATANAIIENGAIQNTVSPQQTAYGGSIESGAVTVQTGGGGFQLSNQDWNEYGGLVEEMASDMTDLQDDNGTMSFMGAIKNAYECLPTKIWTLIFAGVSGGVVIALWKKGAHCH